MSKFFLGCTIVLFSLALAAAATAEEGGDARSQASVHFERGVELTESGQWEQALSEFQEAHRLYSADSILYNLAQCYQQLGRNIEAYEAWEEYIARYGSGLESQDRVDVERQLDRLQGRVGRIFLTLERPERATVLVDGAEAGTAPLRHPLAVTPGRHTVEVRAPSFSPYRQEVTLAAGERTDLTVTLTESDGAEGAGPTQQGPEGDGAEPVTPERRGGGLLAASYALLGVGVATLVAALGVHLWNTGRYDDWDAENAALQTEYSLSSAEMSHIYELRVRTDQNNDLIESVQSVDPVVWALLGVGAAAAVAGVGMLIAGLRRRSSPLFSVSPLSGGVAACFTLEVW